MTSSVKHVLITSIGSTSAISGAKSLRASKRGKYYIVGTDVHEPHEIPADVFCDAVYKVPFFDNPSYINSLQQICKKEIVKYLIPVIDQEVESITIHLEAFEKMGITVIASNHQTVAICNDKYATWKTLKEKGIDTPRVFLPDEFSSIKKTHTGTYYMKPRRGVSSQDNFVITNDDELALLRRRVKDPVLQNTMIGDMYVVDVVNDRRGKNVVAVPRREYSAKSGLGVKAETVSDRDVTEYAVAIAEALGITGIANIEVFKNNDVISFIEINPRLSAGAILTTRAGVNLTEIAIDVFSGNKISHERLQYKTGIYMTRYWQEAFHEKQ